MADDLQELRERVAFSREEIGALASAVRSFEQTNIQFQRSPAPHPMGWITDQMEVSVIQKAPVPVAIRSKAGTIANELRSVLDGLATQLAARNGANVRATYFPISKTADIFAKDGRKKINGLASADQERIAGLRPWRGCDDLLWSLHEADRTRKHQRLGACAAQGSEALIGQGGIRHTGAGTTIVTNCTFNGVQVGDLWVDTTGLKDIQVGVPVVVANASMNAPLQLKVSLAYSDPEELSGRPLVPTLLAFADRVDAIISLFDEPVT